MAKRNSNAPKKAMIFNSVIMINTDNVVSLVNSLPKSRMDEKTFNTYMERNFYFGGKFHGRDFNSGSHYSTVVRQLGLYHIVNDEFIPRFYSNINTQVAESYLRYWLKLYVAPNPTSQPSLKKALLSPKYVLKELIRFIETNKSPTNIYEIVDKIYVQSLSRNDKGNLPSIIKKYSECIDVDENNNVSLKPNYKKVMADIDNLINDPNRYFEHFGKGDSSSLFISNNEWPLQQIFYGAPGTGKSFKIKKCTKGDDTVIRTTFYPDSDYSTFVGCYKPTMEDVDAKVVPVVVKSGISLEEPGVYKEKRIVYKFVQQAFTKAYIQAWKKMDDYKPIDRVFYVGSTKYDIIGISGDLVRAKVSDSEDSTEIEIRKSELEDVSKTDNLREKEEQIHDKEEERNRNEIWGGNPNVVESDPSDIDKIKEGLGDRLNGIGKSLDDAWITFEKSFPKPQFLIIEEINRGNCAQIFGDLFQLLDRKEGYSEYPIEADDDLRKELENEFVGLKLGDDIIKKINDIFKENYPDGITDKILNGELLVLPENLYIWATMNTSDQSLFPIDSAFKRRWEWEYIPIGYKNKDWEIKIGEKENEKKYKWVDFQRKINDRIYSIDNSEDKQLGDFFVDANRTGNVISSDTLLNKILFYIWNDVCKDDPDQIFRWKDDKDDNKEKSIRFSDFFCDEKDRKLQGLMSFLDVKAEGEAEGVTPVISTGAEESETDVVPEKGDSE